MATQPITIGSVVLEGTEASEPVVFGNERMQVRHDFPGGISTIQDFGVLPIEKIVIKGVMFGYFAEARSEALNQLAATYQEVTLAWSGKKYKGIVHHYKDTVHHKHKIQFEIEFWPTLDEANPHTISATTDTTDNNSALSKALNNSRQLLNAIKADQFKTINFPPNIAEDWERMLNAIKDFKHETRQPTQIPEPIRLRYGGLINALLRDIAPIRFNQGGVPAYTASLATVSLVNLRNVLTEPQQSYINLPVTNPNLVQLASQYYGDPSKWKLIARANDLGSETKPKGDFVLKIPVKT